MTIFFTLPRAEAQARLKVAGFRQLEDYQPGSERWRSPSDYEFSLTPEDNGDYEEVAIEAALRLR